MSIHDWMKLNARGFSHEGDGIYATRANGDVGDCIPGKEDMSRAQEIVRKLNSKFGNGTASWDTVDEWTEIYIKENP